MENCHVWLLFLVASAVKNFKASAPTQQPKRNNTNRACLVIDRDLAMPTLSMMHSGLAPNLGVVLITSSLSLSYRSHPASSTNNSAALRQKALGTVHRFAWWLPFGRTKPEPLAKPPGVQEKTLVASQKNLER